MSRPSVHNPITKSYAIDQIEDIEHLRAVAHTMWEAFFAAHSQATHIIAALINGGCDTCLMALTDHAEPCGEYQALLVKVTAGFGSV